MLKAIDGVLKSHIYIYIYIVVAASLFLVSNGPVSADTVDYIVNVAPSFNITLSANNITLDLNPNTKTSDAKDLNIKVATNNLTGYYLTMSSTGNATSLVRDNTVDGKNATIPTLAAEAGATAASLTDNSWGYKQGSGNFIPYVSGTRILENKYPTSEDETTLSFASKINYSQASGTYELGLVITGVTNPMMNYIQNLNPAFCTSDPKSVIDARDMKVYTVQRLRDGQCWMTTDLNLAGGTKLYSDSSDVPSGYPESAGTPYYTLPESDTVGFDDDTKAFVYNSGNETTSQSGCTSTQACNSYYSWLAATAGGKNVSDTAVTGDGYNAAYSICPKGWRLPTATTSNAPATTSPNWKTGDNYRLATAYGANLESQYYENTTAFYDNAGPGTTPNFLLTGNYYNGTFYHGNSYGHYWSSSSSSSTDAYYLTFKSTNVYSVFSDSRRNGFAVRCVLDDTRTLNDIRYMQDINSDIVANTTNNATGTLIDRRDNQKYTVTKINGNLWMTRNLAIGCNGSGSTYGGNSIALQITKNDSNISAATWPTVPTILQSMATVNSTTDPKMECSSTYGAWYNFVATSAGTITGASNTTAAVYDICPSGWRLPNNAEFSTITSSVSSFNPSDGGRWANGSLSKVGEGHYWGSDANNATQRYIIYYTSSTSTLATGTGDRPFGRYIRCIAK